MYDAIPSSHAQDLLSARVAVLDQVPPIQMSVYYQHTQQDSNDHFSPRAAPVPTYNDVANGIMSSYGPLQHQPQSSLPYQSPSTTSQNMPDPTITPIYSPEPTPTYSDKQEQLQFAPQCSAPQVALQPVQNQALVAEQQQQFQYKQFQYGQLQPVAPSIQVGYCNLTSPQIETIPANFVFSQVPEGRDALSVEGWSGAEVKGGADVQFETIMPVTMGNPSPRGVDQIYVVDPSPSEIDNLGQALKNLVNL